MMNGIKSMQEAVERIRDVQNVQIFQRIIVVERIYEKHRNGKRRSLKIGKNGILY